MGSYHYSRRIDLREHLYQLEQEEKKKKEDEEKKQKDKNENIKSYP